MRRIGMLAGAVAFAAIATAAQRVELTLDTSEADAAIAVLRKESAGTPAGANDWNTLFAAAPYRRLKLRETSIGNAFTDEDFRAFLTAPATVKTTVELARTLQDWKGANLAELGARVLPYLPQTARIDAKVYIEIKPARNSFVWGGDGERAIFIYLNPALSRAQFENKIAHEAHHIGLGSLEAGQAAAWKQLPGPQREALRWLGAFGEGEAMLAAAGSPEVHPHAADDAAARQKWDRGMEHFSEDLDAVQRFLLDILDGTLREPGEIERRAQPFYGDQGAWYTVGYRMAAMVEKRFGRAALTDAMLDPRKLLRLYNRAAAQQNRERRTGLALWSADLLRKLG